VDEGEGGSGVLARTADGEGCDGEEEKKDRAGDEQADPSAFLLDDAFWGVKCGRPGATFGGVVGEGLVGIEADGLGDGSDEAAGVDFAGEGVVAAFF
ncbi:MAG: hypothetical protein U1E22_10125, partial [Coriobacteriia bacterium]|nr:hypothetical protein [Coriobacteriia bacterium]